MKRVWMKRAFCALLLLCAVCLPLSHPGARAEQTRWVGAMDGPTQRLNLREKPVDGEVLGQYFAGTPVTVLRWDAAAGGDPVQWWAQIRVGGRKGYVLQKYLVPEPDAAQTRGLLIPWEGDTVPVMNENWDVYMTLPGGAVVDVLGTVTAGLDGVPEGTLHISVPTPNGPFTGYIDIREAAWTEKRAAVGCVRHLAHMDALPVRREASEYGTALCELYAGTPVYMLFDSRRSTERWYHIRVGDQVGYADDHCISADADLRPSYRPMPGVLKDPQAEGIVGGKRRTVFREDPLFILGTVKPARGGTPRYLCLCGGWNEDGTEYGTFVCAIDQKLLETPREGSPCATGKLKTDSPLYALTEEGEMRPVRGADGAETVWPAGRIIWIEEALDVTLAPLDGLFSGYLTRDSAWLRVWIEPGGPYGYLPVDAAELDGGLYLPDAFVTGG